MVDLYEGKRITLNFKSNLLSDLSKITASNSYTIQLPKTVKNRRILDNATAPHYNSSFRYKTHTARYIRNGVEIISNAIALILDSSADYEIALMWGVMQNFQDWIDKAPKLNDLTDNNERIKWSNIGLAAYPTAIPYFYANYNCGIVLNSAALSKVYLHPVVRAWWILLKIQAYAGFEIAVATKLRAQLKKLAIPLTSKKASEYASQAAALFGFFNNYQNSNTDGTRYWILLNQSQPQQSSSYGTINNQLVKYTDNRVGVRWSGTATTYTPTKDQSCKVQVQVSVWFFDPYNGDYSSLIGYTTPRGTNVFLYLYEYDVDSGTISSTVMKIPCTVSYKQGKGTSSVNSAANGKDLYYYKFEFDDDVQLSEGKVYFFAFSTGYFRFYSTGSSYFSSNFKYASHSFGEDISLGEAFSIISNLPDITQIDYIKAICAMFGMFAMSDPNNPDVLKLVSADILNENKVKALDWSDKLIDGNDGEPQTTMFKFGDYARNNILKYKEDTTVEINADSSFIINDETLSKEKTIFTLPFAATDKDKIPHYKWSSDNTKVEKVTIKPRICYIVSDGYDKCALSFAGLTFKTLIEEYYRLYHDIVNRNVTIKEEFTLNEYDLKSLDYTIPIYLRQYGRHFAIKTVQTKENTCDVELAMLPIHSDVEDVDFDLLKINHIKIDKIQTGVDDRNGDGINTRPIYSYFAKSEFAVQSAVSVIVVRPPFYGESAPVVYTAIIPLNGTASEYFTSSSSGMKGVITDFAPMYDDVYRYMNENETIGEGIEAIDRVFKLTLSGNCRTYASQCLDTTIVANHPKSACERICPYYAIDTNIIGNLSQMSAVLNNKLCIGCKLCEPVCPAKILTIVEDK